MSVTCSVRTVSRSPHSSAFLDSTPDLHSSQAASSPIISTSSPLHSSCSDCSICDELATTPKAEECTLTPEKEKKSNVALIAQSILSPMFGRKAGNKVVPGNERSSLQSPFVKRSEKINKSVSENAISGNYMISNRGLPGGDSQNTCVSPKEKKFSRWRLKMKNSSSEDKFSESGSFSSADSKTSYTQSSGKRKKVGKKSHSRGSSFDYRLIKDIFKMSLPRSLSAGDIGKRYNTSIPEDMEEKSTADKPSVGKSSNEEKSSGEKPPEGNPTENCLKSDDLSSINNGKPFAKLKNDKTSDQPFQNNHASISPQQGSGLVGLKNLGNTCFMNSIIQCLSHSRPVREYFLSHKYKTELSCSSKMQGRLAEEFASLLADMWSGRSDTVSPNKFKSAVAKSAPRFVGYSQQDSHEFLRFFMEGLHEDLNKGKKGKRTMEEPPAGLTDGELADHRWKGYTLYDNSSIVDIFVGLLKSTLTCSVCDHKSVTFDPFWDLSLPLPRSRGSRLNLQSCFTEFTQEEILDGDEKPTCESCKKRQKCTKQFSIERFPPILVLHLKRFSEVRYRTKLSTKVDFPVENLDLSDFSSHTRGHAPQYDLVGVSNHSGNTFSGHYIAYCQVGARWHRFSDSSVSGLSRTDIVSSEAYVLFYERKR